MKSHISFSISFLLLSLSGCASTYDPLANVLGPEPNEAICKHLPPTGSRISRLKCMSQEDWDAEEKETEEIVKEWFASI